MKWFWDCRYAKTCAMYSDFKTYLKGAMTSPRDQQTNKPAKNTNYEVTQKERTLTCIFRVYPTLANTLSPGPHASATRQSTTSSLVTALTFEAQDDNFLSYQMKAQTPMPRTPMETPSFTWLSSWNSLVNTFFTF